LSDAVLVASAPFDDPAKNPGAFYAGLAAQLKREFMPVTSLMAKMTFGSKT